jgi:MFS family permease
MDAISRAQWKASTHAELAMEEPAIHERMRPCRFIAWRANSAGNILQLIVSDPSQRRTGTYSQASSFQEVQNHSMLTTSLYLLPNLLVGVCINLSVGIFVDRVPAGWLVIGSSLLSAIAPLMMALVDPTWKYYYLELWAQILAPLNADVLYTVGLIIVSANFPDKTQALAGAVVSTVGQFGTSLGVGLCQVVALGVMGPNSDPNGDKNSAISEDVRDTLRGYRASFWTMFALMVCCVLIASVGLRRTGKVGLKKD